MIAWKPIDTAPVDKIVLMGGWEKSYSPDPLKFLEWGRSCGIARESFKRFWWKEARMTWEGRKYTHWAELPQPPEGEA